MLASINKITSNAGLSDKILFLLVGLFPLTMITGNLLINSTFAPTHSQADNLIISVL